MISKGRHAHGESHFSAKFTEAEVLEMRRRHAAGETYAGIARSVGRPFGMVNLAIKGVTWSHLTTSQHEGQG